MLRRTGGLLGIGVCLAIWCAGAVVSWLAGGVLGGVISFTSLVIAFPALPLLGVPAAGGSTRYMAALVLSGAVWWVLGQLAAARVTKKPVVGRREWSLAFLQLAAGVWVGACGSVLLAAVLLGAF